MKPVIPHRRHAAWLRELASYVDYSRFRRVWLHPITQQGDLAACYERVAQRTNSDRPSPLSYDYFRRAGCGKPAL